MTSVMGRAIIWLLFIWSIALCSLQLRLVTLPLSNQYLHGPRLAPYDETRRSPSPPSSPHGYLLGTFNATKCLFVISTSKHRQHIIEQQYRTYDPAQVGLLLNLYDENEERAENVMPSSSRVASSDGIIRMFVSGIKPNLWRRITQDVVQTYDYIYFLDDDFLFDQRVFSFAQFLWIVLTTDAVISTPKIIRDSRGRTTMNPARPLEKDGFIPRGVVKDETVSDKVASKIKSLEIGSFMMKRDAWLFFLEEIFISNESSDCGADCVWCRVFERETRFGKVPCLRSLLGGITHLDTASLPKTNTYAGECMKAVKGYQNKLVPRYSNIQVSLRQCVNEDPEYIGLERLGLIDWRHQ